MCACARTSYLVTLSHLFRHPVNIFLPALEYCNLNRPLCNFDAFILVKDCVCAFMGLWDVVVIHWYFACNCRTQYSFWLNLLAEFVARLQAQLVPSSLRNPQQQLEIFRASLHETLHFRQRLTTTWWRVHRTPRPVHCHLAGARVISGEIIRNKALLLWDLLCLLLLWVSKLQ